MTIQEQAPPPSTAGLASDAAERDRMLVQAYLGGDDDAFAIIVYDHYDALLARARRLVGSSGQPEDAVQETFYRAMVGLPRFGLSGEHKLGAWLNTILSHVCSDQLTRASRDRELAQVMVAERLHEVDVADQVGDPGSRKAVQEVLAQLKPELRRVLVLREMRGLSYADVAAAENISEEHARVRAYRARNFMAERLNGFKSAAGALVLVPVGRLLRTTSRLVRVSHRDKGAVVSPPAQLPSTPGLGGVPSALDRVASQLAGTPLTQTALTIVSSAPKGAVVFGVAAAVATFSVSAASLDNTRAAASSTAAETTAFVIPATVAPNALSMPSNATGASSSEASAHSADYGWTDAGLPGGSASGALAVGTPTGTSPCVSSNGVTPPGPGFSYGGVLPLTDQVSVGNTSAVDLTTTGGWMSFPSAISITGPESPTASSAVIDTNVCLLPGSPTQSWFTASVVGAGGAPVDLVGSLQAVIGSGDDAGYVFRGVVETAGGPGAAPIVTATQFSALVEVREPDNTAQLTVVFLSNQPPASTQTAPTPTANNGSGTSAADSTPTPTSPVSDPTVPWTPPPGATIPQSFSGGVQWVGFPGSGDGRAGPLTGGPAGPYSGF